MAQILPMERTPTMDATAISSKAAKWDALCNLISETEAGSKAIAGGYVSQFVNVAIKKGICLDDIMTTCRECGMADNLPNSFIFKLRRLVDEGAKVASDANNVIAELQRICEAHGKPRGQSCAAFVNELAENLRSANDELGDIAEQCERMGYAPDDASTLTEFLEQVANEPASGAIVNIGLLQINN